MLLAPQDRVGLSDEERVAVRRLLVAFAPDDGARLASLARSLSVEDAVRLRGILQDYDAVGSLRLIRRLRKVVFDGTLSVVSATPSYTSAFDALQELQHAEYHLSAYVTTSNRPVITDGSMLVASANAITIGLERLYVAGPPAYTQVRVVGYTTGADIDVQVKVWRTPGLR